MEFQKDGAGQRRPKRAQTAPAHRLGLVHTYEVEMGQGGNEKDWRATEEGKRRTIVVCILCKFFYFFLLFYY